MGYLGREVILSNIISPIILNSVKVVPLLLSILGALMAFVVYDYMCFKVFKKRSIYYMIYTFLNSAWQFNYVINHFIVLNILNFAHLVTYRIIDRGLLEIIGPNGVSRLLVRLTQNISNLQSGMVFNYVLIMIIFTALFLFGYRYF